MYILQAPHSRVKHESSYVVFFAIGDMKGAQSVLSPTRPARNRNDQGPQSLNPVHIMLGELAEGSRQPNVLVA